MIDRSYWIEAEWGSRVETPAAIAERFLRTIDGLRTINPILDDWSWGDYYELRDTEHESGVYPLDALRPRMAEAVARNMGNAGRDGPDPDSRYGYMLMSQTERTAPGTRVSLGGSAGERPSGGSGVTAFTNRMSFEVGPKPDQSLLTYPLWRSVLLLLAETWEASWVRASPGDISTAWLGGYFKCAWMSYLSPRLAPLVTPPAGIIVERRPNGGLFMAATTDTFRTADPQHLAAARAIEAALRPMNGLAYPIDDPYR